MTGRFRNSRTMRTKVTAFAAFDAQAVSASHVLSATIFSFFEDHMIAAFMYITTNPPWGSGRIFHELSAAAYSPFDSTKFSGIESRPIGTLSSPP